MSETSASAETITTSGLPQRTVAHNVVHLRAKPSNDNELVSQLLMGQTVTVLRSENGWSYIEGEDTYRGWADDRFLGEPVAPPAPVAATTPLAHVQRRLWREVAGAHDGFVTVTTVFADVRTAADEYAPLLCRLPLLARVRVDEEHTATLPYAAGGRRVWVVTLIEPRQVGFLRLASVKPFPTPEADEIGAAAAAYSRDFLGTPYLWGGSSSFGLDCSGFVQYCYKIAGVILRRDADIQRDDPRFDAVEVSSVSTAGDDLLPGDLVFFGKPDKITHVGMHLAGNTFIHSAGGAGVIISEWGDARYSPGFVDARRLDPARAGEAVTRP